MTLRFECQSGCTRCCDTQGFVYITETDLLNIAGHLGMTAAAFEKKYVIRYPTMLRLRKPRNSQCYFLKETGCGVHPVKPVQCRTYPFWPELVENRKAWQEERARCPGIGKGPLIQIGSACEIAAEMKTAYPAQYNAD